jgi:hypothetical protein
MSASDMSSIPATPNVATATTTSIAAGVDAGASVGTIHPDSKRTQAEDRIVRFDASTRSFVHSLQPCAIQGMLNFDYSCGKEMPCLFSLLPILLLCHGLWFGWLLLSFHYLSWYSIPARLLF